MQTYSNYMSEVDRLRRDRPLFQKVEIEINLGCNRRCSYCYLATKKRESIVATGQREMDRVIYSTLLSQLADLNFQGEVNFHFYAEPLLCKRLTEYVQSAKRELPAVSIVLYTNGDFLTPEKFADLKQAGLDTFFITSHDDRLPAHLNEIVKRSDVIWETRSIILLNNRGGYLGENPFPQLRKFPCVYPSLVIVVTIDGNVLPCSCDFNEQMCFGNITRRHLRDIWHSQEAQSFRSALLAGNRAEFALCSECDYYSGILGLPSAAEANRMAPDGPGPIAISTAPQTRESR
jgi:radical SAM protein with 4Fe4S-binding SPASM domain